MTTTRSGNGRQVRKATRPQTGHSGLVRTCALAHPYYFLRIMGVSAMTETNPKSWIPALLKPVMRDILVWPANLWDFRYLGNSRMQRPPRVGKGELLYTAYTYTSRRSYTKASDFVTPPCRPQVCGRHPSNSEFRGPPLHWKCSSLASIPATDCAQTCIK